MKNVKYVIIFSVTVFLIFSVIKCVIPDNKNSTYANWLTSAYSNETFSGKPFLQNDHLTNRDLRRKITKRSMRPTYPFEHNPQRSQHQDLEAVQQQGAWSSNNYGWGWNPYISHGNYDKEVGGSEIGFLMGALGIKVLKVLAGFGLALKCVASILIAFKAGVFLSPILLPFLAPAYLGAILLPFVPLLVIYLFGRIFASDIRTTATTIINNITNTTTTTTTTTKSPNGRSFTNKGYIKEDMVLIDNVLNSDKCVGKIICDIQKENDWQLQNNMMKTMPKPTTKNGIFNLLRFHR